MDITAPIVSFLDGFKGALSQLYNLLDSITFMGISLLDFSLSVFIISVVLPLVLTLLRSRGTESRKGK